MSDPTLISRDEEHLRLLTIFHFVCAGLAALFACLPILHLILGLVMVLRPEVFGPGKDQPPAFFGWFFVVFAAMFILAGWIFAALLAWAGRCLSRRKHYTFCLVVAGVACLFMPFGTVLGAFTIIVLVRPSVKGLFRTGLKSRLTAMTRAVRNIIRLIAAGMIVIGALSLGLEFLRFKRDRVDFSVWRCVFDFLAVALGVVLFAASSRLAKHFTDDSDE